MTSTQHVAIPLSSPTRRNPGAALAPLSAQRKPGEPSGAGATGRRSAAESPASVLAQLQVQPLFCQLQPDLLSLLAQRAMIRRFGRDDLIAIQDERDSCLHVLLKGRAHLERSGDNGRTVLLGVLGPGDRIGDWSVIDGQPHHASVRCTGAVETLVLRGEDVLACQARDIGFSAAWGCDLVKQLRDRNHRIMCMSLYGVRERVMWRLKEWSEDDEDGQRVVSNRIGRTELARMVGASREMVCRVLRGLQAAGRIQMRRDRSIVLLDSLEP